MGVYALLFSSEQLYSAVILLGSSVLNQHGYPGIAVLILLSGNIISQPLCVMCLLPLFMKSKDAALQKLDNFRTNLSTFNGMVVAVSGFTAFTRLAWLLQHAFLPLVAQLAVNSRKYSNFFANFTSVNSVYNLKDLADLWIRGLRSVQQRTIRNLIPAKRWYKPSLGIRWYLDAQMLPEYSLYFEILFILQPVVCAGLIYFYIIDKDKIVGIHIMMVIGLLLSRNLTVFDFAFSIALLMQHTEIIKGMHNLPFIVAGIMVPLVLSPLMFTLWVDRGTGNANYFFFQGLCLWLFSALGIVEFTASFMRSNASKKV